MIQIELLRISSDSKYMELIIDCPDGFHFDRLEVKRYDNTDVNPWVDCVSLLEGNTTKEVLRINTGIFGGPSMYYVNIGIIADDYEEGVSPEPELVIGVCSDVNSFYLMQHDKIVALEEQRIPMANFDVLARRFFALYAHREAMRLERYTDAEAFYTELKAIDAESLLEPREFETRNFAQ